VVGWVQRTSTDRSCGSRTGKASLGHSPMRMSSRDAQDRLGGLHQDGITFVAPAADGGVDACRALFEGLQPVRGGRGMEQGHAGCCSELDQHQ
jgi:hypothetical protein